MTANLIGKSDKASTTSKFAVRNDYDPNQQQYDTAFFTEIETTFSYCRCTLERSQLKAGKFQDKAIEQIKCINRHHGPQPILGYIALWQRGSILHRGNAFARFRHPVAAYTSRISIAFTTKSIRSNLMSDPPMHMIRLAYARTRGAFRAYDKGGSGSHLLVSRCSM